MASLRSTSTKWFDVRHVRTEQQNGELVAVIEFIPRMPLKILQFLNILINGEEPQ